MSDETTLDATPPTDVEPIDNPTFDVRSLLGLDTQMPPADGSSTPPAGEEPATPPDGSASAEPGTPGSNASAGSGTQTGDPLTAALAQLAENQAGLQSLVANQNQPPPTPDEPVDPAASMVAQLPDELYAALESEDAGERRQAFQALVTGTARYAFREAARYHEDQMTVYQEQVQNLVTNAIIAHAESQRVRTDFYSKYPQLDRPEFHQHIMTTAELVGQEKGFKEWNETWRDETAKRFLNSLQAALGPQSRSNGNPPPTPAPRGGSARTDTQPGEETVADEFIAMKRL